MRLVPRGHAPDTDPVVLPDDPRLGIPKRELEDLVVGLASRNRWSIGYSWTDRRPTHSDPWLELVRKRRVIYALIKHTDGRVSKRQLKHMQTLANAHQWVFIWRPIHWISGQIEEELTRP